MLLFKKKAVFIQLFGYHKFRQHPIIKSIKISSIVELTKKN